MFDTLASLRRNCEQTEAALRTLAVAYRPIAADEDLRSGHALEEKLIFAGTAGIIDPPREEAADAIRATATASLTGRTGVEMEAMTAVSVALLTIYDMAKALDKGMVIEGVRLIEKRGGKSGIWRAENPC